VFDVQHGSETSGVLHVWIGVNSLKFFVVFDVQQCSETSGVLHVWMD
jgi:hypothetical protein